MPRGVRRDDEAISEDASPLGRRLLELMRLRKLSARGLSLSAGLGPDSVRNALRGKTQRMNGAALKALAEVLQVPVWVLENPEDPLPPDVQRVALVAQPLEARRPRPPIVEVPEVLLEDWESGPLSEVPAVHIWGLPAELFPFTGYAAEPVVVVSPDDARAAGVQRFNRIFVDTSKAAVDRAGALLPGVYLVALPGGVRLANLSVAKGKVGHVTIGIDEAAEGQDEDVPLGEVRTLGRLMGRLQIR
jgi:transcriptional regulator with XRE-family HTH domain